MRLSVQFMLAIFLLAMGTAIAQLPVSGGTSFAPFVIPWDDATAGTASDVSLLNDGPAGSHGFIVARNGHFVESQTGKRIRFLGTNFAFKANFPEHADAERIAAHLAKLGINIVRIHHHDADYGALWDQSKPGHTHFDPTAIDKLDYLIAQFEKNGIYVDLNLHVSRKFTPADGFPQSVNDLPESYDKRIDNLDRHMIDLQKQFAHDYLTRVNPYTKVSYVDDPGVALIEINNENTLAGSPLDSVDNYFGKLPEPFKQEVVQQWNSYLRAKYRTTDALRKAWLPKVAATVTGPADLLSSETTWRLEDRVGDVKLTTTGSGSQTTAPDIEVVNPAPSAQTWHKQIHLPGLNLQDGGVYIVTFRAKSDVQRSLGIYAGLDQDDWHHIGLGAQVSLETDWKSYRFPFIASNTVPGHGRISITLGSSAGSLSLADVRVARATLADLFDPKQSVEAGNIDLPDYTTIAQRIDWRAFLVDTEAAYVNEMRDYVRKDLKAHANVVDTQMSYGDPAGFKREAASDYIDNHAYWQHPRFPGKPWDGGNWLILNTPMTDSLAKGEGGEFGQLAAERVSGKPYTISEYNNPAPSDYQAEMFPELASYAALQDWDAIFEFDYGNYGSTSPNNKIQGYFAAQGNPAKEAFLPAAALVFRGGRIAPLSTSWTLHQPVSAPYSFDSSAEEWKKANSAVVPDVLAARFETLLDSNVASNKIIQSSIGSSRSYATATTAAAGSRYVAIGDGAVAAAGYFGGQSLDFGTGKLTFDTFGNNFSALILTTIDGQSIAKSHHLFLTLMGKAQNVGMVWNADRTSVEKRWGTGPAQAETIPATLTLSNPTLKRAWALDPTGKRVKEIPVTANGRTATLAIGPVYQTIWYEIGE